MEQDKTKLKYFIYCRKSTEGEEKQALSIESQVDKAREVFSKLKIVGIIEEKKSAFTPENRPEFAKMIARIKKSEANGIIAWHPDRLSRNEVDAATLTYMIRTGQLKDLKFGSYNFDNSPEGIMMLQMALSQSQYYSAKLGKDVKRGLEKKVKMGWMPGVAPSGYLNEKFSEKGYKKILVDPERFPLIRKMWDLMLTGNYSPPKILKIANDDWGYKTLKRKKEGGFPMSRSGIYKMFTNIFYAGVLAYEGQQYEGKHKPMITLEEYDRVQMLLGREGKPRPVKHVFPLTGMIRCGECGCLVTAETKKKILKKSGNIQTYTYYHCTKRREDYKCSQKSHIRAEKLESQIDQEIGKYTVFPEFLEWALEYVERKHKEEAKDRGNAYEKQHRALVDVQTEIDGLIRMKCKEQLSDDDFKSNMSKLEVQKIKAKKDLRDTENRADKWDELTVRAINFVTHGRKAFATRDAQAKREIFSALGSNFLMKDRKLTLETDEWIREIKNGYPELEREFVALELADNLSIKDKTEALASVRTRWLQKLDDVRTCLMEVC